MVEYVCNVYSDNQVDVEIVNTEQSVEERCTINICLTHACGRNICFTN